MSVLVLAILKFIMVSITAERLFLQDETHHFLAGFAS